MINLAISIALLVLTSLGLTLGLKVHLAIALPLAILVGLAVFLLLGRKVQGALEILMTQMQRDVQAGKLDRAIETLKKGFAYKHRHIFVGSQLNAQIGMLYYLKKEPDNALPFLQKGFLKHYVAQGMLACIYFKSKDYNNMKKVMDRAVQANSKESLCYGLYAFLLEQIKERDQAIVILQKGIKKLPTDQKLISNLTLLQNDKKMKMKIYGDMWLQFMLERPPRIQQEVPPHMRMRKRALFK